MSVHLVPMTEEEYGPWLDEAVRGYAADHIRDGSWSQDEALEKSAAEFHELLPQGLTTPNQYLFSIHEADPGPKVGYLWFAVRHAAGQRQAFVYDFVIFAPFRRLGYGAQAFEALEAEVRARDIPSIGLHVFGDNVAARRLYTKLGYIETNVVMRKDLP